MDFTFSAFCGAGRPRPFFSGMTSSESDIVMGSAVAKIFSYRFICEEEKYANKRET